MLKMSCRNESVSASAYDQGLEEMDEALEDPADDDPVDPPLELIEWNMEVEEDGDNPEPLFPVPVMRAEQDEEEEEFEEFSGKLPEF